MKRRVRKKLHVGEFQELGFEIRCLFIPDFSDNAFNAFIDEFMTQAIESQGLSFGGGGDTTRWGGFITLNRRGSLSDEHRTKVSTWLASKAAVREYQIGQLVDAWYG